MTGARLLAIDVGTQSARAIVFDAQGRLLARAQVPFEPAYHSPQPGWAEQPADVYWSAVAECCRRLWREGPVAPGEITGLALTTQRCTVVCLDGAGRVLRPAILWLDQRRCEAPPPMGATSGSACASAGGAQAKPSTLAKSAHAPAAR